MHELSLVQSMLDIVEDHAREHGFDRVNSLKISFGRLSCIDRGSLEFAFSVQAQGTRAEGATLICEINPVVIHCFCCAKEVTLADYQLTCPLCGKDELTIVGGREELKLIEMDVD